MGPCAAVQHDGALGCIKIEGAWPPGFKLGLNNQATELRARLPLRRPGAGASESLPSCQQGTVAGPPRANAAIMRAFATAAGARRAVRLGPGPPSPLSQRPHRPCSPQKNSGSHVPSPGLSRTWSRTALEDP